MDDLTKLHTHKLLARIENISPFSNIASELQNYSIFILKCSCEKNFPVQFVSEGVSSIGFSSSDILKNNQGFSSIISEKDFGYYKSTFNKYSENKKSDFFTELTIINPNNELFETFSHTNIVYENGVAVYVEIIIIDITHEKQSHINLKRLKSIINDDDLIYLQQKTSDNGQYKLNFLSNNISYYGYNKDKFLSSNIDFFEILYPEDRDEYFNQLNEITQDGISYYANTFRIITPKNEIIWAIFETLVHFKNGNIRFVENIIHDITEQKEHTIKLLESQKTLTNNLNHNRLISEILKLLQVTEDYDISIKIILQKLADFTNVSLLRIYIPNSLNTEFKVYTYDSIDSKLVVKEVLIQKVENAYPNIMNRLKLYGTAYCDAYGASKKCQDEFEAGGLYSYLIYTISLENNINGYISITDKNKRTWDNEIVSLLSDISQIISGLFYRYWTQLELSSSKDTFKTVLDNIDVYVCATNIDTDEIIFTNKKFNDNFSNNSIGRNYWEMLDINHSDISCLNANDYYARNIAKPHFFEVFTPSTNQWLDITEIAVTWNDGNLVKLFTMSDITQKVAYEKMIEEQAVNDHLTELPNRRMLERDFPRILEDTIDCNGYGFILFLDLDNFKNVNDGLGHQYGDALLHNIALFLKTLEFTGDVTYRFGGDEFIILIKHEYCTEIDNIVEKLLERFRKKWILLDTYYYCTMSMGVAKFPNDGTNLFDIMKKVDMAMYSAKKLGKNRAIHYKSKIGFDSIRNIEIERYLRESISNSCHGFKVYFQPIINTKTKELEGAEALLRWTCENLGMIPPTEFIPLAENLGLIVELGDFVIKQACAECKRWISMGNKDFKININLSVGQLLEPDIVDRISDIVIDVGIPFSNVAFEVTESLAINDMEKMKDVLNDISALGIEISLDDFGTGYSSLNNIKEMPLNTIKIDKSFIDDLVLNSSTEIFVKTIINLAHALKMRVCAEGVEEEIQYNRLFELDADVIQGYYFGRPIPADEFEKQFNLTQKSLT